MNKLEKVKKYPAAADKKPVKKIADKKTQPDKKSSAKSTKKA